MQIFTHLKIKEAWWEEIIITKYQYQTSLFRGIMHKSFLKRMNIILEIVEVAAEHF